MSESDMPERSDTGASKKIKVAVSELVSNNNNLTNAEVADKIGTHVSIVRDIRQNHENKESDCNEVNHEPNITDSAITTTNHRDNLTHSQEVIQSTDLIEAESHILSTLEEAVVKIDPCNDDPVVRNINQGFVDTFGYTASEIVGDSLRSYITPEGYTDSFSHPNQCEDSNRPNGRIITRKTTNGVREFLCREIPTREDDGCRLRVYTDVTGQKRRELELQRQIQNLKEDNQQLEDKSQQLEQFASILSHDLRNPINIAEGYLREIETEENGAEVAVIERALSRMNALIEDTLTLKDQSQPVEELEYLPVKELAEAAWELVDTGNSELRIVDRFELACDDDRITRLFENLFRNAIEHNDEPVVIRIGIHDTLTTSTRGETKKAFHVSDDGRGIPEDKREQMFEVGKSTTREGTGLGLPIIKRIAKAHHWTVRVEESFDGGAKFVFTAVDIN
jgi:PAS domain S-box